MSEPAAIETDPRFPSGPWVGFFTYARSPVRFSMDLAQLFRWRHGRRWPGLRRTVHDSGEV